MTTPTSPTVSTLPIRFDDGEAYELMMGRWSALVAEPFLDWLDLPQGLEWLDDGCGNGSFTAVLMARQRPSSVVGVDPSSALLAYARQREGAAEVRFMSGDAQALPMPDACVDAAVMALVLFFLPDPALGLRELVRVTRSGGAIAAYHWDLAGGGFPLQSILDAVRAEGHTPLEPASPWIAALDASAELWDRAGLLDVQTRQFEVRRRFDNFDHFWRSAQGSPRLRELFLSLAPAPLQRVSERVRRELGVAHEGPVVVRARANAIRGHKP